MVTPGCQMSIYLPKVRPTAAAIAFRVHGHSAPRDILLFWAQTVKERDGYGGTYRLGYPAPVLR